ncbi:MAG: T9SS type A sorting domain-containing protein [Saprospiraceae bacterium]
MKKRIYTLMCFLWLATMNLAAQNDTLVHEDFLTPFDNMPFDYGSSDGVSNSLSASSAFWVNYDADGIPTVGNAVSKAWYWDSLDFVGDNLGVLKSQSWLEGLSPDNRNWLILPAIQVVDANAILSWKSAPYQGPAYLDGYTVLVSTTGRDVHSTTTFTDTLFHAAEMDSIINANSLDLNDYVFSEGYVHANNYTDATAFIHPGETAAFPDTKTFNLGQLESHTVDLAAYSGRTIYIAFLHDSQNDNTLELDDILVTGTTPIVSTNKISEEIGLEVFPNPVHDYVMLSYDVVDIADISIQVFDMQGRLMQVYNNVSNDIGKNQHRINVSTFPTGSYNIVINTDEQRLSKRFVKH